MVGLPKNIIKKYGVTKKAWAVYRKSKSKTKKTKSYSIKRTSINKMARRKKRKVARSSKSSGIKPQQILIGGGLYGAARRYIDGMIKPVTSKIPLGTIADEVALFGLGWLAHKNVKDKTLKSVAVGAMAVEAARIGEAISDGSAFANIGASSNGAGLTFQTIG